jgi:hypothetical protein
MNPASPLLSKPKTATLEELASTWESVVRETWKKPVQHLPVHSDLPRLATKMTIVKFDGKLADNKFDPTQITVTPKEACVLAVGALCECFHGTEERDRVEKKMEVVLKNKEDISIPLKQFLADDGSFADHRVTAVLKCCQQQLIIAAYYKIKHSIQETIRDIPGTWRVTVTHLPSGQVRILHCKKQRSESNVPGSESTSTFVFDWELEIVTNDDLTQLTSLSVKIPRITFDDSVPSDKTAPIITRLKADQLLSA